MHSEASSNWRAYLAEKYLNRSLCNNASQRNLQKEDDLLRKYQIAAARQRIHRVNAHPEEGLAVRAEDLELIAEADSQG